MAGTVGIARSRARYLPVLRTVLAGILLATCPCLFALDPTLDISQYAHTTWKIRDGFVKGEIPSIAQTPDGYLWLGTEFGLLRFDGVKTVPWQPPPNQHLATDVIRNLLATRDGTLWIGTTSQGLLHVHHGRVDALVQPEGLSSNSIGQGLFEDREGNIWVSTTEGLDRFRDFAVTTMGVNQGLLQAVVGSVLADRDGSVWLSTINGLNRWNNGQITVPNTGNAKKDGKLNGQDPHSLFQDSRGRIWISTLGGVGYLENDRFVPISGIPSGNVLGMAQDTAGNLWITDEFHGLFRVSSRIEVRQIPWGELGHKDHASVLAADPSRGGIWIGFFLGGIAYLEDGHIRE